MYTDEKNAQIVLALLKEKGIRRIIISPGTTNGPITGSVRDDPFFEVFSAVDERSAAYMACGMAHDSGEPVALSCTGATASRNYLPGLTEAFYRKLPVLAITSMVSTRYVGNLRAQVIDRSTIPNDVAKRSVTLDPVVTEDDFRFAELQANIAMEELFRDGGGPSHIQLITEERGTLDTKTLPPVTNVRRLTFEKQSEWPPLSKDRRILVFLGAHANYTENEIMALESFVASHDAVVFTSAVSGYRGRYAFRSTLPAAQLVDNPIAEELEPDLIIHIGEMSGDYDSLLFVRGLTGCPVWRVSEDGELRQEFGRLERVFQSSVERFFSFYASEEQVKSAYRQRWSEYREWVVGSVPDLPFSAIWIAKQLSEGLPRGAVLHPSIMSSLAAVDFSLPEADVETVANVGGFGIDGCVSSLLGASLVRPDTLYFGLVGDLAFFYDMNCLGNRHVGGNLRIILVNNNVGMTFKHTDHYGSRWGDVADEFLAAGGHNLPKDDKSFPPSSVSPAAAWATAMGFRYLRADDKAQFQEAFPKLVCMNNDAPLLLECFTLPRDERAARDKLLSLDPRKTAKRRIRETAKAVLPQTAIRAAKSVLGANR